MCIMQSLEGLGRGVKFVVYRKNKTTPVIFDIFENFIFLKYIFEGERSSN